MFVLLPCIRTAYPVALSIRIFLNDRYVLDDIANVSLVEPVVSSFVRNAVSLTSPLVPKIEPSESPIILVVDGEVVRGVGGEVVS